MSNTSSAPWYDADKHKIIETLLFSTIIGEHALVRMGSVITDANGKKLKKSDLQRIIFQTISLYLDEGAADRAKRLCEALLLEIPEAKAQGLQTITAAQLAAMKIERPQFIIDELLPCGLCVLAAPPKTGKSWLCLDIASNVANGNDFWHRKTSAGDVLYLALEDNESRIQERLKALNVNVSEHLHLGTKSPYTIANGLLESLQAWVDGMKAPRLIIIDTLARVKGSGMPGLDAYHADYQLFSPVQEFAMRNKICVILVTHLSKQKGFSMDDPFERISGSTGLFGVADASWIIYGKRGQEQEMHVSGRDVENQQYKIKIENLHWEMIGTSDEVEEQKARNEYKDNPVVKTIRHLIAENGEWHGKADQLMQEVAKHTGVCPATNSTQMGVIMTSLTSALVENDGIFFSRGNGGRAGRNYDITKVQKPMV